MKILLSFIVVVLLACSGSTNDTGQSPVKSFLKANLKNPDSYKPITFTGVTTLTKPDTSEKKLISPYQIGHTYSVTNSVGDKVEMSLTFYLDEDYKVNYTYPPGINGDYGTLKGNVSWKENNDAANKADAGAEATLYFLDSTRNGLKYETTADVQGNYTFEKLMPGRYFLIVRSKNTIDCPEQHLQKLFIFKSFFEQLFGFNINDYQAEIKIIKDLNMQAGKVSKEEDAKYGGHPNKLAKITSLKNEMRNKADELIKGFPNDFKQVIKLSNGYSNAYYFMGIQLDEGETDNKMSDFGISCQN